MNTLEKQNQVHFLPVFCKILSQKNPVAIFYLLTPEILPVNFPSDLHFKITFPEKQKH